MLTTNSFALPADDQALKASRSRRLKKIFKIVGFTLLALILILVVTFFALFGKEVSSISSINEVVSAEFFTMTYKGNYGLDELLKQGVATDGELVTFVSQRLLKGLPLKFDLPDLGCSTFAAQTPDGDYIFGRNFDNKDTPVMLVRTNPKGDYASISVVNLSFIGYSANYLPKSLLKSILALAAPYAPLDGVNEKGLAIGVLQLDVAPTKQDTGKLKITTTAAIRMILDKAATVDEAIALLSQYDMQSSANGCYHFQIADAFGKSVVVEYVNDEMVVLDLSCATNFFLAPGDMYDVGGGQNRYEILVDTLTEKDGILTAAEGMDLLKAVKQDSTQWSALYNNTKQTLSLSIHGNYTKIYEYSVK